MFIFLYFSLITPTNLLFFRLFVTYVPGIQSGVNGMHRASYKWEGNQSKRQRNSNMRRWKRQWKESEGRGGRIEIEGGHEKGSGCLGGKEL